MKKKRINILRHKEINGALSRYITSKLFESRIMEHPQQALERTSFNKDSRVSTEEKK
jgi:hypothetical protein